MCVSDFVCVDCHHIIGDTAGPAPDLANLGFYRAQTAALEEGFHILCVGCYRKREFEKNKQKQANPAVVPETPAVMAEVVAEAEPAMPPLFHRQAKRPASDRQPAGQAQRFLGPVFDAAWRGEAMNKAEAERHKRLRTFQEHCALASDTMETFAREKDERLIDREMRIAKLSEDLEEAKRDLTFWKDRSKALWLQLEGAFGDCNVGAATMAVFTETIAQLFKKEKEDYGSEEVHAAWTKFESSDLVNYQTRVADLVVRQRLRKAKMDDLRAQLALRGNN